MSDTITLTGLVATTPKHLVTGTGLSITTFRLASHHRRFDKAQQQWIDAETNWYTVTSFRQLATNVVASLQKGQRIVVTGRLRVRDWATDDKTGTNIEVDAEAIGHDLAWGTTVFTRSAASTVIEADQANDPATAEIEDGEDDEDVESRVPSEEEPTAVTTPF